VAPVGTLLRHLGGVLDQAGEVAGLLRADQIVAVPLGRQLWSRHRAGPMAPAMVAAAIAQGAAVVPAAVIGHETGRRWRVVFGPPIELPAGRTGVPGAAIGADISRAIRELLVAST
jgi:hypothetical protein